jgi:hypothetical protein
MEDKSIHEELASLSQLMNRIGQKMMNNKDSLYQMHGASLIESGDVIISWSMTLKGMVDNNGLEDCSSTTETVSTEAEGSVEESVEANTLSSV